MKLLKTTQSTGRLGYDSPPRFTKTKGNNVLQRASMAGLINNRGVINNKKLYELLAPNGFLVNCLEEALREKAPGDKSGTLIEIRVDPTQIDYAQVERLDFQGSKWYSIVISTDLLNDLMGSINKESAVRAIMHEVDHDSHPIVFDPTVHSSSRDFENYLRRRSQNEHDVTSKTFRLVGGKRFQASSYGHPDVNSLIGTRALMGIEEDFFRNLELIGLGAKVEVDRFPDVENKSDPTKRFIAFDTLNMLTCTDPCSHAKESGDKLASESSENDHNVYAVGFPESSNFTGKWVVRWFDNIRTEEPNQPNDSSTNTPSIKTPSSFPIRALSGIISFTGINRLINYLTSSSREENPAPIVMLDKNTSETRVKLAKSEIIGRVLARYFFEGDSYAESDAFASKLPNGDAVVLSKHMDGFNELFGDRLTNMDDSFLSKEILFFNTFNISGGFSRSFLVNEDSKQFSLVDLKELVWSSDSPGFEGAKLSKMEESLILSATSCNGEKVDLDTKRKILIRDHMLHQTNEWLEKLESAPIRERMIKEIAHEASITEDQATTYIRQVTENTRSFLREIEMEAAKPGKTFSTREKSFTSNKDCIYFDEKYALGILLDDPNLLKEIISVFILESENFSRDTKIAIDNQDDNTARRLAHTLKGALRTLIPRESPLITLSQSIETAGAAGDFDEVKKLLDEIEPMLSILKDELKNYQSNERSI